MNKIIKIGDSFGITITELMKDFELNLGDEIEINITKIKRKKEVNNNDEILSTN